MGSFRAEPGHELILPPTRDPARWSRAALYVVLLGSALAFGADRGWTLAAAQIGTLVTVLAWLVSSAAAGRLEWRRTALDLPLALLVGLVLLQLLLGNRPLVAWALAPPPSLDVVDSFPARLFTLGTVAPGQTARSLLWLLSYAAIYYVVINVIRERAQLDRLVRTLVIFGGAFAFFALLDYLTPTAWLPRWPGTPPGNRLAGTFANPDHFATWLGMTIFLGIGYLAARRSHRTAPESLLDLFRSQEGRERLIRRQLPFVGVVVMTLGLLFTLSRGGIMSLLVAVLALLAAAGGLGLTRWSLVATGGVVAATLAYAAWIGLDPLLHRAQAGPVDLGARLTQYRTSFPMLEHFPVLGVGLGAYKDIYFRYQPLALGPGAVYFAYAHNDLLQLVLEVGLVGAACVLFAVWRVGRDLLGAHLLGRGRCPVGGGEGATARRHDLFSTGLALGALGAVFLLLAHGVLDFSARIPANGLLAAACLGMATVALHTRFRRDAEPITGVRTISLAGRRPLTVALAVGVLLASLGFVYLTIRTARVDAWLTATPGPSESALDRALALDPSNPRGLVARGRARLEAGTRLWQWGAPSAAQSVAGREGERRESMTRLEGAVSDLQAALVRIPTDPTAHERLGWAHAMLALVDPAHAAEHVPAAVAHARRAIALAPENPLLRRSLAALALSANPPLLPIAVQAGRDAVEREPALLPDLVERLAQYGLRPPDWLALAPPTVVDRLYLAVLLDARGLRAQAREVYGHVIEAAAPPEMVFARWALARSSLRLGDARGALQQLDIAIRAEPDNPELELARGQALEALGDTASLDAYRAAVTKAQVRRQRADGQDVPFALADPRTQALAVVLLGPREPPGVLRYRRSLARHLVERKVWDEARETWEALQIAMPNDAAAHFYGAVALDHLGQSQQALESYRKAVGLDGQDVGFRLRLAQKLWEADRFVEAMAEWNEVIRLAPQNVEARVALTKAYVRFGEKIEALREYEEVVRLAPDHPVARKGFDALMQAERRSVPTPTSR